MIKENYKKTIMIVTYLLLPLLIFMLWDKLVDVAILMSFDQVMGLHFEIILPHILTIIASLIFFKLKYQSEIFWILPTGIMISPVMFLLIQYDQNHYFLTFSDNVLIWIFLNIFYVLPIILLILGIEFLTKEEKRIILVNIILTIIAIFLIISGAIFIVRYYGLPRMNQSRIEVILIENQNSLEIVATYMLQYEKNDIWFNTDFYGGCVYDEIENVTITDEKVIYQINYLFEAGFLIISKNYNTVTFFNWFSHRFERRGIAFTSDYKPPTDIIDIIHYAPLSIAGWFYIEVSR